ANAVRVLKPLELLNDRPRIDNLTLKVDNLNAAGKPEFRALVAVDCYDHGEDRNDQKHKGSSTKEEPDEHAVAHYGLAVVFGVKQIRQSGATVCAIPIGIVFLPF